MCLVSGTDLEEASFWTSPLFRFPAPMAHGIVFRGREEEVKHRSEVTLVWIEALRAEEWGNEEDTETKWPQKRKWNEYCFHKNV